MQAGAHLATLERAIAIATAAHAGQVDKAGAPYILHPLRVMLQCQSADARIAAVLHDVIEDTTVTLDQLRAEGFSEAVRSAIEAVTKRPEEHGAAGYAAFIRRAARHPLAREVKLADLDDNMDVTRLRKVTAKDRTRLKRYAHAKRVVTAPAITAKRITLRPLASTVALAQLTRHGRAIVCDFYIDGIEASGTPTPWGFKRGLIENIDHHANQSRFRKHISSTHLAIIRVRREGIAKRNQAVVINHTDCDSVLSSAIVAGLLEPYDRYGVAALAADHTGEPNDIADLLQGLDPRRDVELSLASLNALEAGLPLPVAAAIALEHRLAARSAALAAITAGKFSWHGDIAFAECEEEIDGEFFAAALPNARIVVIGHPHRDLPGKRVIKTRLGPAARKGASLQLEGFAEWDIAWGGRWNAGSNKRGGGTTLTVKEWVIGASAKSRARQTDRSNR